MKRTDIPIKFIQRSMTNNRRHPYDSFRVVVLNILVVSKFQGGMGGLGKGTDFSNYIHCSFNKDMVKY